MTRGTVNRNTGHVLVDRLRFVLISTLAALTLAAGCTREQPGPPGEEPPTVLTSTTTPAPAPTIPQLPTTTVENQEKPPVAVEAAPPGDEKPLEIEEVAQVTVRTRSASLDYLPGADSFSFANFGGGEAPADLTVNMARRLYGDAQVCAEVADNQCTPYPVILQLIAQANRSMRGGLCEGLTVLSLRLAADPALLAGYQGTKTVAELVKADPALLSELAYWYVTQFATEVQEQASAFLELAPITLAQVLLKDFADAEAGKGATGYTIGIYSEQGGHAVTPYRVEQIEDQYRIFIYDSNWPTAERWIDVNEDGWTYALAATNPTEEAAAWGGGVGTMELTPMTARSGPFSCGFCPADDESEAGTLLTVAGAGDKQMAIKIETEAGQRLGYYDGAFVNEIPGATYRYLISGPTTADPVLVFLPPGVDDFSADVGVVDVPAPVGDLEGTETTSETVSEAPAVGNDLPGQGPEEDNTQQFSLLVLDEERSVQIDAAIDVAPVEAEETPDLATPGEPEIAPEPQPAALLSFTEEAIQVGDIEEAVVEIAVEAVAIQIELDQGQQIEVVFAEAPPIPVETAPGEDPAPPPAAAMQTLSIEITAETGQSLAEVSIDVPAHVPVEAPASDIPLPGDAPVEETPPEPVAAAPQPVQIEITYDEELGEVTQVEDEIDAWVASDAEYFRAVAEDRVEEVLGESYVEELEEREEWAPLVEDDELGPLIEVIQDLADDYWEDEHWDEVDYDDEWFEEELAEEPVFTSEIAGEWWLEEEELDEWLDEEVPFVDVAWDDEGSEVSEVWDELLEAGAPTRAEMREDTTEEPDPEPEPESESEEPEPEPEEQPDVEPEADGEETPEVDETEQPVEEPEEPSEADEPEVDEEPPPATTAPPPTTTAPPPTTTEPPPTTTVPPPTTTVPPPTTTIPPPTTTAPPPPTTTAASWDRFAGCRGTSACEDAPGGFDTWEDYDAANDPTYYDDWGVVPVGFTGWAAVVVAVEAGEVDADVAGDVLPDFVVEQGIVEVYEPPVYQATVTSQTTVNSLSETLSTSVVTTQTGTATATNVTTSLTNNDNDGYWYEAVATATTVTTTHVDTTTVVARAGADTVTCTYVDNVESGCSTQRSWEDSETTVTASDPYTAAATTTANSTIPASCSQGGWTGLGDWCIVESGSRTDYEYVQFELEETTNIRIDADTNLTYAQFVAGNNQFGDPYIFLNHDTNAADGAHSGDASAVTVGTLIESDDDGGRDCSPTSACINPPSNATDPDEFPNSVIAWDDGDTPVIVNVSDAWDSRIERMDLAPGDYVVRGSVYNSSHDGWYRLTIREDD